MHHFEMNCRSKNASHQMYSSYREGVEVMLCYDFSDCAPSLYQLLKHKNNSTHNHDKVLREPSSHPSGEHLEVNETASSHILLLGTTIAFAMYTRVRI